MGRQWNLLRDKTWRRYVLSYTLIGIIPIIFMSIALYTQSWLTLSQRYESQMLSQAEQMKAEMDSCIAAMHTDSVHFAGVVSSLADDFEDPAARAYSTDVIFSEQLRRYADQFQIPCEVLYYPKYAPHVYTTKGAFDYYDFWREQEYRQELDMSQFYTRLNTVNQQEWIMSLTSPSSTKGNMLLYFSPIPPLDAESRGTVAFLFDKDSFNSLTTQYCGDFSGYFVVFNPFYNITYSLDRLGSHDTDEISHSLRTLKGTGVVQHSMEGEKFVTARAVSHTTGFIYLYSVPASSMHSMIRSQTFVYLWLIGALLLICVLLAILLAVRSVKPIRRLAEAFLPAHAGKAENENDMLKQLHSHYEHVMSEQNALLLIASRQEEQRRRETVEDLLHGRFAGRDAMEEALRQAGITLGEGHCFVIALRMEDPDTERALEALAQLWIEGCSLQAAEDEKGTVALIVGSESPVDRMRIANEAEACVASAIAGHPSIGVGTVFSELLRMDMSYCEALAALKEGDPLFREHGQQKGDYLCPASRGEMLRQVLLRGNAEMAVQVLRHMADSVQSCLASSSQTRVFCFFIVSILMQIRSALGAEQDLDELIRSATYHELPAFVQTAEAAIKDVCALVLENSASAERKRVADIMAYIRQNFAMYDISAETVAAQFNLSESHLRRIFKEHAGQGISSYVTALRFERVKEQLIETDMPIRDIIADAGYVDVSSFTRKFRNLEGATPGQYRSLHRKE